MSEHYRFSIRAASAAIALALSATTALAGPDLKPVAYWKADVEAGKLPPVAERVPSVPLIVDMEAKGRTTGTPGGTLRTMVSRSKDVRQMVVYGYARLVGYDENYEIKPDILESVDNQDDKVFTMHLRPGLKWSDGEDFTSDDFAYWWNDVANNEELSPSGPPDFLRINGKFPTVTFPDDYTVVYAWEDPNPAFLGTLAQAAEEPLLPSIIEIEILVNEENQVVLRPGERLAVERGDALIARVAGVLHQQKLVAAGAGDRRGQEIIAELLVIVHRDHEADVLPRDNPFFEQVLVLEGIVGDVIGKIPGRIVSSDADPLKRVGGLRAHLDTAGVVALPHAILVPIEVTAVFAAEPAMGRQIEEESAGETGNRISQEGQDGGNDIDS